MAFQPHDKQYKKVRVKMKSSVVPAAMSKFLNSNSSFIPHCLQDKQ